MIINDYIDYVNSLTSSDQVDEDFTYAGVFEDREITITDDRTYHSYPLQEVAIKYPKVKIVNEQSAEILVTEVCDDVELELTNITSIYNCLDEPIKFKSITFLIFDEFLMNNKSVDSITFRKSHYNMEEYRVTLTDVNINPQSEFLLFEWMN